MNFHTSASGTEPIVAVHSRPPAGWPSAGSASAGVHFTIFQSLEFVDAWLLSFGKTLRWTPYFVEVSDATGAPMMLLPLCVERHRGMRVLSLLDQGQADYTGPVLFGAHPWTMDSMRALWRRILQALPAVDVVRLEKIPPTIDGVANPLHLIAARPDVASAHGNRLDQPWADVERGIEYPKQVLKKERSLLRTAPAKFVIVENADERARILEQLIVQKQRRFEEMRVAGYVEKPEHLAFLRHATSAFAQSGNLLLSALMVGDEAIAVQWALVQGGVVLALVNGFEGGTWTRFSCGRILNYRLMKCLHERGFVYFDQGYGNEPYKLRSSDTTVPLFSDEEARTAKGWVFLRAQQLRAAVRTSRLGARLRQAKWLVVRGRRGQSRLPADEPGSDDA